MEYKPTLYEKLVEVENAQRRIDESLSDYRENVASLKKRAYVPSLDIPEIKIDIPSAQRSIFSDYKDNEFLRSALRRTKSLEESADELTKPYMGIRKYLPRLKDGEHNDKVEQLTELVPHAICFKTRGILYPDNPLVVGAGLGSLAFAGIYFGVDLMKLSIDKESRETTRIFFASIFQLGIIAASIASIALVIPSMRAFLSEEAQYIDNKIKELSIVL